MSSQIGAQACFTVLLSYLLGKTAVNLHMALSMIIIIAGVACSCVPLWVVEQSLDRASLPLFMPYLSQLFGTSLVLLSAAAAAARAVLEEVIMLEEDGLSPLLLLQQRAPCQAPWSSSCCSRRSSCRVLTTAFRYKPSGSDKRSKREAKLASLLLHPLPTSLSFFSRTRSLSLYLIR